MLKNFCVNKIVLLKVSFPKVLKALASFIHLLLRNVENLFHKIAMKK